MYEPARCRTYRGYRVGHATISGTPSDGAARTSPFPRWRFGLVRERVKRLLVALRVRRVYIRHRMAALARWPAIALRTSFPLLPGISHVVT